MNTQDLPHQQACAEWSNRILILSLLGIAYFTLFPFHFDFSSSFEFHRIPFLLGTSGKKSGSMDFFLNVLLFVPFGFGLCARLGMRGGSRGASFLLALAAGAGVSYTVELLQFYIPQRDSGWEDVISNSLGSMAGFLLFALCGGAILEMASRWENSFETWLTPRRTTFLLVSYFAVCFGVSYFLQTETRLSNWDPRCVLFVGNDASGQKPWSGQVFLLQIWNRALPEEAVRRLVARQSAEDASAGLLGSYDFTTTPPYQDGRNSLPALGWISEEPHLASAHAADLDATAWLSTKIPVENLTQEIKKSSKFTVHLLCAPATAVQAGRIVSLSRSSSDVNFNIRQDAQFLSFYFRTPLSDKRAGLALRVDDAFDTGKVRDIVASYDGSDAFVYLDGNRVPEVYHLSPGASFMHHFFYIATENLEGYVVVYETLIFLPAGLLIGMAAMKWTRQKISGRWTLALGLVLPAVLLEIFLAGVSGRGKWAGNVALSLVFGLAGVLLANADWQFKKYPGES
jgi:glycopeptide antibiotics resistance protein